MKGMLSSSFRCCTWKADIHVIFSVGLDMITGLAFSYTFAPRFSSAPSRRISVTPNDIAALTTCQCPGLTRAHVDIFAKIYRHRMAAICVFFRQLPRAPYTTRCNEEVRKLGRSASVLLRDDGRPSHGAPKPASARPHIPR